MEPTERRHDRGLTGPNAARHDLRGGWRDQDRSAVDQLADKLDLTPHERAQLLPSGKQPCSPTVLHLKKVDEDFFEG